jgi:hypothetical protein
MFEPVLNDTDGIFHRQRPGKDAAARTQAQESEQRRPRKSDAAWIIETAPQCSQCRYMLIAGAIDGVEKRVDVREDHRLRRYRSMSWSSSMNRRQC